ncbi:MAG: TRAP transporter substrate-binding protein DctP [Desulfobacteraceae bacterium]|jgi:TRAP-type C4-dicarboxylate transport system substrate-binding protein|nr:TRAP transporter substrate-binding protein DctP [Desulfobacteraceae bacterium]
MNLSTEEIAVRRQVGAKIRELRLAAGRTAVALARQAGLSQGQLSKIETGKAALSIAALTDLCRVLDRPLSYLFQKEAEIPRVLGTMTTVAGPENRGTAWFAEQVARRSQGRLSLVPLKATLLGTQTRQATMLREGFIDLFIEDLPAFRELVPALDLLSLPYVFKDESRLAAFLQSAAFEHLVRQRLIHQGVRPINRRWNWRRGLEWVILATRPITHPDQVRGLRVRIFESALLAEFWKQLGAHPVVIPWPRVRRAWLRGEVDLLPTHKAHLYPLGFCRRGRFVTRLDDVPPVLMVAVNEARYGSLPPALQTALVEACDEAGDFFSAEVARAEPENEAANMRRHAVSYLNVDPRPWIDASRSASAALIAKTPRLRPLWEAMESFR